MVKAVRKPRGAAQKVWRRIYLRGYRELAGLSIEALGEKSGVSGGQISLIENNQSAGSPHSLEALADALRIDVGDLFTAPEAGKRLLRVWVDADDHHRITAIIAALRKP